MVVNNVGVHPYWKITKLGLTRLNSEPSYKIDRKGRKSKKLKRSSKIRREEPRLCSKSEFAEFVKVYQKASSNISVKNFDSSNSSLNDIIIEPEIQICGKANFIKQIKLYSKTSSVICHKGSSTIFLDDKLESPENINNNLKSTTEKDTFLERLAGIVYQNSITSIKKLFEYHTYISKIRHTSSSSCNNLRKSESTINPMKPSRFYESQPKIGTSKDNFFSNRNHTICREELDENSGSAHISKYRQTIKNNPLFWRNRRQYVPESFYNRNIIVAPSSNLNDFPKDDYETLNPKNINIKKKLIDNNMRSKDIEEEKPDQKIETTIFDKFLEIPRFSRKKFVLDHSSNDLGQDRLNGNERKRSEKDNKIVSNMKMDIEGIKGTSSVNAAMMKQSKIIKKSREVDQNSVLNNNKRTKTSNSKEVFNGTNIHNFKVSSISDYKSKKSIPSDSKFNRRYSFDINLDGGKSSLPRAVSVDHCYSKRSSCLAYPLVSASESKSLTKQKRNSMVNSFVKEPSQIKICKKLTSQLFPVVNIQPNLKMNRETSCFCAKNNDKPSEKPPKIFQDCFVTNQCFARSSSGNKKRSRSDDSILMEKQQPCFPEICGPMSYEPNEVRYAHTVISIFGDFITYEVLKSTSKRPHNLKNIIEDVFVVKT